MFYQYFKNQKQNCYMCDSPAISGEHIPPNCFFTKRIKDELKKDLLKVPSCKKHNHDTTLDDEYSRLVLAAGCSNLKISHELFFENILPKAHAYGGSKLLQSLHNIMQPVIIETESKFTELMYKFKIDKDRINILFKKIIFGIFWHHRGFRIPDNYNPIIFFKNQIPSNLQNYINIHKTYILGHEEVLQYKFIEVETDNNQIYIAIIIFNTFLIQGFILKN
ncbi:MAG: hypothetical protein ACD_12C00035G0001 [uncultured bacterium]|nr:MAG: hypothetical protein ACD_12C00035G0001 [uncultured bacterium]